MKLLITTLIFSLSIFASAQKKQMPKKEAKKPTEHFIAELSTTIEKLKHPSCALRLNETTELTLGKTVDVFGKAVFIGQRITITPRGNKKGRYNALITYETLGEPDLDHKTGVVTQANDKYFSQILVAKGNQTIKFTKKITLNIAIRHVTAAGKDIE